MPRVNASEELPALLLSLTPVVAAYTLPCSQTMSTPASSLDRAAAHENQGAGTMTAGCGPRCISQEPCAAR